MDRLLPILATVVSTVLTMTVLGYSKQFSHLNLLNFITIFTNLFLATHSETDCSSLLSVAVISLAVVANVYSVESAAYIDTQVLLSASGRSFLN